MNSLYTVKWVTYNGTVQCRHCYGMDELIRQMMEFIKVPVYRIEVWSALGRLIAKYEGGKIMEG